jgi:ABC-2 type transport system ATP-binding protein
MILKLRDEGRTVFFSSHILADAEALCSRVGILAAGRLVSSGRLADLLALQARGWEVVMSHVSPALADRIVPDVVRATPIGDGRYAFEIGLDARPAAFVAGLEAEGARLVSLNPLRETLEDVFVSQVAGRQR